MCCYFCSSFYVLLPEYTRDVTWNPVRISLFFHNPKCTNTTGETEHKSKIKLSYLAMQSHKLIMKVLSFSKTISWMRWEGGAAVWEAQGNSLLECVELVVWFVGFQSVLWCSSDFCWWKGFLSTKRDFLASCCSLKYPLKCCFGGTEDPQEQYKEVVNLFGEGDQQNPPILASKILHWNYLNTFERYIYFH